MDKLQQQLQQQQVQLQQLLTQQQMQQGLGGRSLGQMPQAAAPNQPPSAASQQQMNMKSLPIRAYLDQTVVPILLDGT